MAEEADLTAVPAGVDFTEAGVFMEGAASVAADIPVSAEQGARMAAEADFPHARIAVQHIEVRDLAADRLRA